MSRSRPSPSLLTVLLPATLLLVAAGGAYLVVAADVPRRPAPPARPARWRAKESLTSRAAPASAPAAALQAVPVGEGAPGAERAPLASETPVVVESPGCPVVERRWLARHQDPDGGWSARGWSCACGLRDPPGAPGDDLARTALAVGAFLLNGHTHRFGMYKRTVQRGVRWLDGRLFPQGIEGPAAPLRARDRLLAGWIFAELGAMTGPADRWAWTRAQAALDAVGEVWARGARLGAEEAGWGLLALRAGRRRDLELPALTLVLEGQSWRERALALLADPRPWNDPARRDAIEELVRAGGPDPTRVDGDLTGALFFGLLLHEGRAASSAWLRSRLAALLAAQRPHDGACSQGSWDPAGGQDRVLTTALASLSLEVYYIRERAQLMEAQGEAETTPPALR